MQNESENLQFQPNIPLKSKYCRLDLPADFPIVCMQGDLWYASSYNITMVHFHNCLQIGYCYRGGGYSLIGTSLYPYAEDCVSIIPAKVQHHCNSQPNRLSRWKWLYLDPLTMLPGLKPDFVKKLMSVLYDSSEPVPYTVTGESEPEIVLVTKSIIYALENQREGYRDIVRSLVQALMVMLLRAAQERSDLELASSTGSNLDMIAPAIQHISANYMNNITIPELAGLCHISPTHLRRMFAQVMECTPLEFLQLVRLEAACALLLRTNASVIDIGTRAGFPTETSFLRQFKKNFGTTPGRWRREFSAKSTSA